MPSMEDSQVKAKIGDVLNSFTKICMENNYMPGTAEFDKVCAEHFLLPIVLLCDGDIQRADRLRKEYGREHDIPIFE